MCVNGCALIEWRTCTKFHEGALAWGDAADFIFNYWTPRSEERLLVLGFRNRWEAIKEQLRMGTPLLSREWWWRRHGKVTRLLLWAALLWAWVCKYLTRNQISILFMFTKKYNCWVSWKFHFSLFWENFYNYFSYYIIYIPLESTYGHTLFLVYCRLVLFSKFILG